MASGKTFAAIQLVSHFLQEGYRVFWISEGRNLRHELDVLTRLDNKICVVADGYRNFIDEIRFYAKQRPLAHVLIMTERTVTHDLLGNLIESFVDPHDTLEVILDTLEEKDIEHFDSLINFAGLWGNVAGLSSAQRIVHVRNNLGGSLYRILLEVIRSRNVQNEIKSLLLPLKEDEPAMRFFITAFVSNVLGYSFWV